MRTDYCGNDRACANSTSSDFSNLMCINAPIADHVVIEPRIIAPVAYELCWAFDMPPALSPSFVNSPANISAIEFVRTTTAVFGGQ